MPPEWAGEEVGVKCSHCSHKVNAVRLGRPLIQVPAKDLLHEGQVGSHRVWLKSTCNRLPLHTRMMST